AMQHRWSGPRVARPRGTISPSFPGSGPNGPPSTCTTPRWRLWTTPKRTPPSSEVRHDPHLARAGRLTSSKGGKAEAGNVAPLPVAAAGRIRRTALRVPADLLQGYRGLRANRYLEREFHPGPGRACAGLAGTPRRGRPGHPGNQVHRREVSVPALRGRRIRGSAPGHRPVERGRGDL